MVVNGSEVVKVVWKKIGGASAMFLASNSATVTMVTKGAVAQKGWQQI